MLHNERETLLLICTTMEQALSEVDPIPETMEKYMETIRHAKKLKQTIREYDVIEEAKLRELRENLERIYGRR